MSSVPLRLSARPVRRAGTVPAPLPRRPGHDSGVCWGEPAGLLEIPVAWSLDDFPYLEFLRTPSGLMPGLRDPAEMFANWTADLDYMVRDFEDGVLTVQVV
ncbi:polysaccharide deacetylase family protein [Streptomyces aureus]|uniref:hypothetical protein n=1 Tax=Streptomyces aureus TaxID=193461 RepID=UPI0031DA4F4A